VPTRACILEKAFKAKEIRTKSVPEVSIKDQIKQLVELQKIDGEVYAFKKDLQEKPAYLADLKNHFEAKKANLKSLEEKSKAIVLQRKSFEGELKSREEEIVKTNAQLSQLKTNKEYQAKINEIEHIKADKSIIEEKILLSYDEVDKVNAEIEKEKAILAEEEKGYLSQKVAIETQIKEIEDKLKVLNSQRSQMTAGVDPANLAMYEKILEKKEGVAIVPIQGHSCGGCFMNTPEQMINEIRMHDHMVSCEMCNRILYLQEEL